MFDPKNVQAVFISFGLTLWDALPVFIVVGVASAIVVRTLLQGAWFFRLWERRRLLSLAGAAYLFLLSSDLLFGYLAIIGLAAAVSLATSSVVGGMSWQSSILNRLTEKLPFKLAHSAPAPVTEIQAAKSIASMLFTLVLVAAAVSALLKVYGSELDWDNGIWNLFAVLAALLIGLPPGVAVIPAATLSTITGSQLSGLLWIAVAATIELLRIFTLLGARRKASQPSDPAASGTN